MGGIGDEPALAVASLFQAVEHHVHRRLRGVRSRRSPAEPEPAGRDISPEIVCTSLRIASTGASVPSDDEPRHRPMTRSSAGIPIDDEARDGSGGFGHRLEGLGPPGPSACLRRSPWSDRDDENSPSPSSKGRPSIAVVSPPARGRRPASRLPRFVGGRDDDPDGIHELHELLFWVAGLDLRPDRAVLVGASRCSGP